MSLRRDLSGPRAPRWVFTLLDENDAPRRELKTVSGGTLELSATTRLRASGSLSLSDDTGIDYLRDRVQITYDPGVPGVDPWPLAVMLFTSPEESDLPERVDYEVEIMGKLAVLDGDATEASFSLPEGTPIIPAVVSLIQGAGENSIAATASDSVLRNPLVWEAFTPKLTIINDLLEAAGYWALWTDGAGQFRVEPYQNPADRTDSWRFAEDEYSILAPEITRSQDLASVPNKFVVVGQGDDEKPALSGVAYNRDPNSPFSYQNRGKRWITAGDEGVEGDSQEVFNQLAQRRLLDNMSPVAAITASHGIVPLMPNDVISLETERRQVRATVQRMGFSFEYDAQCDAEWREVVEITNDDEGDDE